LITSKSDITKEVARLRDFNYLVLVFQGHRKLRMGFSRGMSDYLIIGHGIAIFAEGKMISTKDKLSEGQEEFKTEIQKCEIVSVSGVQNIFYYILDEHNTVEIVDKFIKYALEER